MHDTNVRIREKGSKRSCTNFQTALIFCTTWKQMKLLKQKQSEMNVNDEHFLNTLQHNAGCETG